jgi:phosphoglycerate dehydrogenase-like enzyme
MKVLVQSEQLLENLNNLLPDNIELILSKKSTEDELIKLVKDVDVIVAATISANVVKAANNLKLIQKTGVGVNSLPFDVIRGDTFVTNTSGTNPDAVAEGAVALVLALAKRIVWRHNNFLKGKMGDLGIQLKGKKAGILGLGNIGSEVARRLYAFDMRILGLKRNPKENPKTDIKIEFLGGPEDLFYLLRESDFLILTLPLTPETKFMIGEKQLKTMKPSAFVVNVARAAIIQEEPFYRALKEKWIAGAALDVWWNPHWWDKNWNQKDVVPSRYPFWELPNVIATPHNIDETINWSEIGGDTSFHLIAENIIRVSEGKEPINQVNKMLRY